ncbi:MAG: hypothetical protein EXS27_05745 [Pedosphaera sp.]|nr:hypothetical protein [Pedosphaera sp.]
MKLNHLFVAALALGLAQSALFAAAAPNPTVPSVSALVRLTAISREVDGDNAGKYRFRVSHESGPGPLQYDLKIGGQQLASGTIGIGEIEFVWLPYPSAGVKVVPAGLWTNSWGGTASSNTNVSQSTTTTSPTPSVTTPPPTPSPTPTPSPRPTQTTISVGTTRPATLRTVGFTRLNLRRPTATTR